MGNSNNALLNNAGLGQDADDAIANIPDLGQELQQAMGINIDSVDASEIVLVALLMDDSGSIRFEGNSQIPEVSIWRAIARAYFVTRSV